MTGDFEPIANAMRFEGHQQFADRLSQLQADMKAAGVSWPLTHLLDLPRFGGFSNNERAALLADGAKIYAPRPKSIRDQVADGQRFWSSVIYSILNEESRCRYYEDYLNAKPLSYEVAIYPDDEQFLVPTERAEQYQPQLPQVSPGSFTNVQALNEFAGKYLDSKFGRRDSQSERENLTGREKREIATDTANIKERLQLDKVSIVLPEPAALIDVILQHNEATGQRLLSYSQNDDSILVQAKSFPWKDEYTIETLIGRFAKPGDIKYLPSGGLFLFPEHTYSYQRLPERRFVRWVVPTL